MKRFLFVGRAKELDKFQQILKSPTEKASLVFVSGDGGTGKTWLIEKMLEQASKIVPQAITITEPIDMYTTGNRDIVSVIASVYNLIIANKNTDISLFTPYEIICQELTLISNRPGYSEEIIAKTTKSLIASFSQCLRKQAAKKRVIFFIDTFENVQDLGLGQWIINQGGEDPLLVPGVIILIGSRKALSEECVSEDIVKIPLAPMTDTDAVTLFGEYLRDKEWAQEHAGIIGRINQKVKGVPLMLGLGSYWLNTLQIDQASSRLEELETDSDLECEFITFLSPEVEEHGPFFLGGGDLNIQVLYALAAMSFLNRRFNKHFLKCLVQNNYFSMEGKSIDLLWKVLNSGEPHFFFVKNRPKGEIQLHDRLAEMLRKYVLRTAFDPRGDTIPKLAKDVLDWYDDLIDNATDKEDYLVEKLVYALGSDFLHDFSSIGYELFKPDFSTVKTLLRQCGRINSDILIRKLFNELLRQEALFSISQFTPHQQFELFSILNRIGINTYNLTQAREFQVRALEIANNLNDPVMQIQALIGLHNNTWQQDLNKSLDYLFDAMKVCSTNNDCAKQEAVILHQIGFTYRNKEDLVKAIDYYERAEVRANETSNKEILPFIYNDLGFAYTRTGNYFKARTYIEKALDLRGNRIKEIENQLAQTQLSAEEKQDIQERLLQAEFLLGTTYNTLGELNRYTVHLHSSVEYYETALRIFRNQNNRFWQARALFSLGEVCRRRATMMFNEAGEYKSWDVRAERNIQESIEMCENYGLSIIISTAYRRLGRLFHDRFFRTENAAEKLTWLERAGENFSKALHAAHDNNDVLEILENATEIAFLADDRIRLTIDHFPEQLQKNIERSREYLETLQIELENCRKEQVYPFQFAVFEHLLVMEKAAYLFEQGTDNYDEAMLLNLEAFTGLAKDPGYGTARLRQHLDHLVTTINRLDDKTQAKWRAKFVEEWQNTTMEIIDPPQTVAKYQSATLGKIAYG